MTTTVDQEFHGHGSGSAAPCGPYMYTGGTQVYGTVCIRMQPYHSTADVCHIACTLSIPV